MRYALTIGATVLAAWPALATEPDVDNGALQFRANCATCHGMEAKGDGPMTSILQVQPPDLTQIAPGGVPFPMGEIVRKIDGRDLLAHGGAMPVFGFILEDQSGVVDAADGTPVFTSQAVVDIAYWLASIQE
ncbi:MAG: cytochrome c [Pseudomonadota bacterium]